MKELIETNDNTGVLLQEICTTLQNARHRIAIAVNSELTQAYWQIGKYIVEYEQKGESRAQYSKQLIAFLSGELTREFGSGFSPVNLRLMRRLYQCFPIQHTLCVKLTWSHYRIILKVENEEARKFYISECSSENWSVRQLERQVNTLFYERLLASRDKAVVKSEIEASVPREIAPKELIRDPYVLEFLGIPQGEHFLEGDMEQMQMYVNYYTRELMNPGDNPPIGIVLCADKSDTMVHYTLPEGENRIFASKYLTYMPTEEQLKQLLEDSSND
ncbi:MAG: PDDEXK nuclease domain-containing protein [Bacteroidales bacterium]|nr:PDDEXK nuclease domain-containing protein [Bacteroidales bacterium]MDD4671072.1 PDDEXK nuclease domain-containing protein [Bacteroidales bacterium]